VQVQRRRLGVRSWHVFPDFPQASGFRLLFVDAQHSANEAKRMWLETFHLKDQVDYVAMDSKADDADLFREFKRQRRMNLIT
jgi:hypothetical protein